MAAALSSLASLRSPSLLCLSFLFSLSAFFCFFRRIHCTWAESASPFQFLLSTKQAGKGNRERERGVKPVPARCLLMSKFRVTSSIGCIGCLSCPVSRVHVHVMDIACELANFAEFLCRILPLNEMESKWRQGEVALSLGLTHNRGGVGESSCKLC